MTAEKVYLKGNVLAEPLFNQWYAWSSLIAPATSAMFVANSHLKIMQSFINAPDVHVNALRNPAMRGGPFIGHHPDRVKDVRELLERTSKDQSEVLEFAAAMGQEPWLTYLTSIVYTDASRPIVESNRLVAECRSRGIESERLFGRKEIELEAGMTMRAATTTGAL